MKFDEMKSTIDSIMFSDAGTGLYAYAYLKDDDKKEQIKRFNVSQELKRSLLAMLKKQLQLHFIAEGIELDSFENIADNRNVLYEVPVNSEFNPFPFLSEHEQKLEPFTNDDQSDLRGFFFKVNLNDNYFWIYQHNYQVRAIKRETAIYILSRQSVYSEIDDDIIRIDKRIDLLLIGNSIIAKDINVLQANFGFRRYIFHEANKTLEQIKAAGYVTSLSNFIKLTQNEKLTFAKKIMKAKRSPVFKMNAHTLAERLKKHTRYKNMFTFDGDKIIISTNKSATAFVKMLNDQILRSDLTNVEYDASSKRELDPA